MTGTRRNLLVGAVLLVLVAGTAVSAVRHGVSFDFRSFSQQVRLIDPLHAVAAVLLIYASFFARSFRWAVLLRRHRSIAPFALLGTQFTGFAAVSLFGRIADLSRPYLVARKTGVALPVQVAVYTLERMFDLGAAALIFSGALAFTPRDLPHHEVFIRVGVVSLAGTVLLAGFAASIRVAGSRVAAIAGRAVGRFSPRLAAVVESRILGFREGLRAINSAGEFALTAALSLLVWFLIAFAYVQTAHSFAQEPTLAAVSFPRAMLLMGASIGSSLLQLPVIGWFTQIAGNAAAMHAFYGTPLETATACGALLLGVTFLSVIPVGLVYARVERVRLGDLKQRTEEEAVV